MIVRRFYEKFSNRWKDMTLFVPKTRVLNCKTDTDAAQIYRASAKKKHKKKTQKN